MVNNEDIFFICLSIALLHPIVLGCIELSTFGHFRYTFKDQTVPLMLETKCENVYKRPGTTEHDVYIFLVGLQWCIITEKDPLTGPQMKRLQTSGLKI